MFSDSPANRTISGALAATGDASTDGDDGITACYAGDVFVSGNFTATVILDAQDSNGDWHGVCSFTEPGVKTFRFANYRPVRMRIADPAQGAFAGPANFRIEPLTRIESAG